MSRGKEPEPITVEELDLGDWPEEKFKKHFPDVDPVESFQIVDVELPTKFAVCSRCRGKGSHVNPNIDGNGITSEEWDRDWDEESRENYMSGLYDVRCYECDGNRVVPVVDTLACKGSPVLEAALEAYREREESDAEMRAIERMERRAEGGWREDY